MSLTYGFDIKSHEDRFLAAAERALATLEEATVPGAFLVDTFPVCACKGGDVILSPLSVVHSEAHSIVVPWSQVQTVRTSCTKGL